MSEVKKVNSEVLRAAIELLMGEIKNRAVSVSDVVNMSAANAEALGEDRGKAASVEAVYNAVKSANHAGFAFVKSEDGKTFDEMMATETPKELVFYVFMESDTDETFDLYVYNSQRGKYIPIITRGEVTTPEIDLSNFWSKDELDITTLAKTTDIPDVSGFMTTTEADAKYATKESVGEDMTVTEVAILFEQIKNGQLPPLVGTGEVEI